MKNRLSTPRNRLLQFWPAMLFLVSFAVSVVTTYYATKNILDADASSELVLSHYLAHSKDLILTKDWFYSTELRVLNTQLIYSTLFRFFSDWSFVRFCSAMIMQVILLLSCAYLLHEAGFGRKEFFLSGSLLLLPVSVAYGRIVLYHCYYIPHLVQSFLLLGLTFGFAKPVRWRSPAPWIRLTLLCLLSFASGLGGVRQLMITHAPLLLCIAALCFLEDTKETDKSQSNFLSAANFPLVATALAGALFSFLGMSVNSGYLAEQYYFQQSSAYSIGLLPASDLPRVVYGFFHHFGFRDNLPLLSVMGILSIGGIFVGGYSIWLSCRRFLFHKENPDIRKSLIRIFFPSVTFITLVLFLVTGETGNYHYVLYLLFSLPWAIVLLVTELAEIPPKTHILRAEKLLPILALIILLANGTVNVLYFNGSEKFDQRYEGLSFQNKDLTDDMAAVSAFLLENEYDIGYATFWNTNVLTEITNGRIRVINVHLSSGTGRMAYVDWLSIFSIRDNDAAKPFLLIAASEIEDFLLTEVSQYCSPAYEDSHYYVFDVLQEDAVKAIFNAYLF